MRRFGVAVDVGFGYGRCIARHFDGASHQHQLGFLSDRRVLASATAKLVSLPVKTSVMSCACSRTFRTMKSDALSFTGVWRASGSSYPARPLAP